CATGGARRPLVKKGTFSDDVLHRWRTLLVTKNSARRASIGSLKSATLAGATYSALLATIRIRPSL
ncbi:hypothetical protein J6590_107676, partial [Homalodisca vitripennis]